MRSAGESRRTIGWSFVSLVEQTAADEYRLQALIQGIVRSVPFQQRRGERHRARDRRQERQ